MAAAEQPPQPKPAEQTAAGPEKPTGMPQIPRHAYDLLARLEKRKQGVSVQNRTGEPRVTTALTEDRLQTKIPKFSQRHYETLARLANRSRPLFEHPKQQSQSGTQVAPQQQEARTSNISTQSISGDFVELGQAIKQKETQAPKMPPEHILRAWARANAQKKGVPVEQELEELRRRYSGGAQETRQAIPLSAEQKPAAESAIRITPEEADAQEVSEEELRITEEWAKEWLHGFLPLQIARTPEDKEQYLVMIAQKVRQQRKLLDETYPRPPPSLFFFPGFYGGIEGMDWEKQRTDLGMNTCQFAAVGNALRSLGVYDEERHSEEAFIRHLGGDTYVKSVTDAGLIGASTNDAVRALRELCPEVQVERTDSVHEILQAVKEGAAAVVPLLSSPSHVGSIPPEDRVWRKTDGQLYVPVVDPLSGVNDSFPIERLIKSDITLAPFPDASAGFIIRSVTPPATTETPPIPAYQRRSGETVKGPGQSLETFTPPPALSPEPPPLPKESSVQTPSTESAQPAPSGEPSPAPAATPVVPAAHATESTQPVPEAAKPLLPQEKPAGGINIVISNVPRFSDALSVQRTLQGLDGVREAKATMYEKGVLSITLDYDPAKAQSINEALAKLHKEPRHAGITIEVSRGEQQIQPSDQTPST